MTDSIAFFGGGLALSYAISFLVLNSAINLSNFNIIMRF